MSFIDLNSHHNLWELPHPERSILGNTNLGNRETIAKLFSLVRDSLHPQKFSEERFQLITVNPNTAMAEKKRFHAIGAERCVLYDTEKKQAYYPAKTFQEKELYAIRQFFDQNSRDTIEFIAVEKENWKQLTEEIDTHTTKSLRNQERPLRDHSSKACSIDEEEWLLEEQQQELLKDEKEQRKLRALHAEELDALLKKSFFRIDTFETALTRVSARRLKKTKEMDDTATAKEKIFVQTMKEAILAERNWCARIQQELDSRQKGI